jgi:hypothetical protein
MARKASLHDQNAIRSNVRGSHEPGLAAFQLVLVLAALMA